MANEKAVCDLAAAGDSGAPVHRVPVVLERSQSVEPCEALDGEKEQMRAPSVEIQTRVDLGAYSPQQLLEAEEVEEDDTGVHTYVAVPAQLQENLVSAEGDALNGSGAEDPAKASEQADDSSEQNTGIEKEKSQDLPCTQQTPQVRAAETDPASAVSVFSDRMTEAPQVEVVSSDIECSMEPTGISSASLVVQKRSVKQDGKDLKLDMDLILSTEPVEGQMTTPPDAADEMVGAVEPSTEVYETETTTLQTLAEARDVQKRTCPRLNSPRVPLHVHKQAVAWEPGSLHAKRPAHASVQAAHQTKQGSLSSSPLAASLPLGSGTELFFYKASVRQFSPRFAQVWTPRQLPKESDMDKKRRAIAELAIAREGEDGTGEGSRPGSPNRRQAAMGRRLAWPSGAHTKFGEAKTAETNRTEDASSLRTSLHTHSARSHQRPTTVGTLHVASGDTSGTSSLGTEQAARRPQGSQNISRPLVASHAIGSEHSSSGPKAATRALDVSGATANAPPPLSLAAAHVKATDVAEKASAQSLDRSLSHASVLHALNSPRQASFVDDRDLVGEDVLKMYIRPFSARVRGSAKEVEGGKRPYSASKRPQTARGARSSDRDKKGMTDCPSANNQVLQRWAGGVATKQTVLTRTDTLFACFEYALYHIPVHQSAAS